MFCINLEFKGDHFEWYIVVRPDRFIGPPGPLYGGTGNHATPAVQSLEIHANNNRFCTGTCDWGLKIFTHPHVKVQGLETGTLKVKVPILLTNYLTCFQSFSQSFVIGYFFHLHHFMNFMLTCL